MIVKVKNNDDSWNYYEGDSIFQQGTDSYKEDLPENCVHLKNGLWENVKDTFHYDFLFYNHKLIYFYFFYL